MSSRPESAVSAELPSALAPLRSPVFRMLWGTWLVANTCMWMNDVAAAWLMTSLTTAPIWVALVQTASTMPMFLLGLPSGALADIFDRRRFFMVTQFWIAGVALLLCVVVASGHMTPGLLLLLVFANGIGLAMRLPVFAAILPELVPRLHLPAALALSGVSMNAARIIGPLVAGALIAGAGSLWVFVLNAALSVLTGLVIMRWRREHVESPLGREPFFSAMRVGVQFVRQSLRLRAVLLRIFLSFFHASATMALLPLVAHGLGGGNAGTFTLLLASMGLGAICTAMFLPRVRQAMGRDSLVMLCAGVQAVTTATIAFAPNVYVAVPAIFVAGMAWIASANALSVSAQMALPDWVRARGMSIYQMAIMGGSALGAAWWGNLATMANLQISMAVASVSGVVAMVLAVRLVSDRGVKVDLTPSNEFNRPVLEFSPGEGHVQMTVEYRIDPARADEFRHVMQETRRSRLRQGARAWELQRDVRDPGRFVEVIIDESWTEHLRRFDRVSAADVELRDQRRRFHIGDDAPVVTRCIIETGG